MLSYFLCGILLYVTMCLILVICDDVSDSPTLTKNEIRMENFLFSLWGIPLIIFLYSIDKFMEIWYTVRYRK